MILDHYVSQPYPTPFALCRLFLFGACGGAFSLFLQIGSLLLLTINVSWAIVERMRRGGKVQDGSPEGGQERGHDTGNPKTKSDPKESPV